MTGPLRLTEERGVSPGADAEVDGHLIGLIATPSVEFEQYLVLRRALERAHEASGLSVVAVTSPSAHDGKTTTAINLAAALARNPRARVLLVDADLRQPSVAAQLGMVEDPPLGLTELLTRPSLTLAAVALRRPAFNLSVVTAGSLDGANPYELFQSARFAAVVVEARAAYDFVVIDTPPVIPVADCRVLDAAVDGFLIVVAAHQTPRRLLAEALSILGPEKSVGLVFNRADRPFRGAYGGYGGYSGYADAATARRFAAR